MPLQTSHVVQEISIRFIILLITIFINLQPAFKRKIQPEEWWRYKYSIEESHLLAKIFFVALFITPISALCVFYNFNRDPRDVRHSCLALTLAGLLNFFTTSLLKVTTGRHRPNFFFRCFPDGKISEECTGNARDINQGRQSFPSGHSSMSFTMMTFLTLYLFGKLNVFNKQGLGQSWRLCVSILPLIGAGIVAVSRSCNYQHHWEDILFGGSLGTIFAYICYRQYYPSIFDNNPGVSYEYLE